MAYIQIPDGIYPRPITNFLTISLQRGMEEVPLLPNKNLLTLPDKNLLIPRT